MSRPAAPPSYHLIRSKRKTIALIVERDGQVVVRAPLRTDEAAIRAFVAQKAGWINEKQALVRELYPPQAPRQFVNGEQLWYLGRQYPLEIVAAARPALVLNGHFRLARAAQPHAAQVFERWYRAQAAGVIGERVQYYAAQYGLRYEKVRISAARTRWGSCSARGTLSFTWRLVLAPLAVIDYVVLHELAHLRLKNHSKQFWQQVEAWLPDYRRHREWLKKEGGKLGV